MSATHAIDPLTSSAPDRGSEEEAGHGKRGRFDFDEIGNFISTTHKAATLHAQSEGGTAKPATNTANHAAAYCFVTPSRTT
jgi:hypothetical protein